MPKSAKKRKLEGESPSGSESSSANGSSLSEKDKVSGNEVETDDKFVHVTDKTTKTPKNVELSSDGTLAFSSLESGFPGCWGLEYSIPSIGYNFVVPFDDNYMVFTAPSGGWKGKEFEVTYRRKPPVADVAPVYMPLLDDVKTYCFFIKINNVTTCVTRIHKSYFATFRHLAHKNFNLENKRLIYSDDKSYFLATVVYINDHWDFILFKADTDVKGDGPPISHSIRAGDEIRLYGRGKNGSILGPQEGIIHSYEEIFGEKGEYAKLLTGTIQTNDGDSGGAVFDSKGLLAMNVGRTFFPDHPQSIATNKAAYFNPFNFMVLASSMISVVNV
ncbi:unnamed protein product [Meloidogyne enterolobii]|uniref:Uncharacterized protein n=1 Tax=Meloidogyne enterolobii TaxID=390850 RepID=A0ACB0YQI6_MELEN